VFDAVWHLTLDVDPDLQERTRRKQILELARYGRLGGGLHDWDDEPVVELRAWWDALKELMDKEDSLASAAENR
jgi:hypothetical protein